MKNTTTKVQQHENKNSKEISTQTTTQKRKRPKELHIRFNRTMMDGKT